MAIYTKTGDKGETGLAGGSRVSKDNLRVHVGGLLDETNAVIGVAIAQAAIDGEAVKSPKVFPLLKRTQSDVFDLGALVASPKTKSGAAFLSKIKDLEASMDDLSQELEPLKNFILPGGSLTSAHVHLARTVCRRAERQMVRLRKQESLAEEEGDALLIYLNRLSDYLFVVARYLNSKSRIDEIKYLPG